MSKQRRRVLLITTSSDIGGTERTIINFLTAADKDSFEFFICSLKGQGLFTTALQERGFIAHNLKERNWVSKFFWLWRFIRERQVVIIHSFGLTADLCARILGRLARVKKIVCSIRGPETKRHWLKVLLDRFTASLSDLFISNSQAGKTSRTHRERLPADKIIVIYNGLDSAPGNQHYDKLKIKLRLGLPERAYPIVGLIANLRPMKGHLVAMDALQLLEEKYPEMLMLFVGRDDSDGEIPEEIKCRGLDQLVKYLGFQEDIWEVLALLDIFILPSKWEGCPTSILEAMVMKVPVIAANVGGVPEIVEDKQTGLLIPPDNPRVLAEAIEWAISHPDAVSIMVTKARQRVEETFSIKRMVGDWQEAYEKLLKV